MNIEYIHDEEIWAKADAFRDAFVEDKVPPIDVIYVAEIKLQLDIIPTPGLFANIKMDAALSNDLTAIYVDEESYMGWESGLRWVERRLRFSVAHEIAHFVLHGEHIKQNLYSSLDDFRKWASAQANYRRAEIQADEFAGRLLVPLDILREEYDRHAAKAVSYDPNWQNIEGMREHIAKKIAPRFGVNYQVVEVRFAREGLWPIS